MKPIASDSKDSEPGCSVPGPVWRENNNKPCSMNIGHG